MNPKRLIARLRAKGYKVTPQRLAICELVLASKTHPTADQIHQELRKQYPTISLATVYQTLHLLTDMGLLQELGFNDRNSRYDPNLTLHINVICLKCGAVYDYEAKALKECWSRIIGKLGLTPVGQRLDLYWHCDECKAT